MNELFKIYKIDRKSAEKIELSENEIHTHDFEELIIGLKGAAEHFIDFSSSIYQTPFTMFVTKGKVHRIQPIITDDQCDFWVIRFKSEFLAERVFHLYAIYHLSANLSFLPNGCFQRIDTICRMMNEEMMELKPDLAIIKNLLTTLFSIIESERKKQLPGTDTLLSNQNITFRNFLTILEENFRRSEGINFYAEKLFMSSRNLNLICKNIMQQSVSEIIETRKMIEAKNLLITTEKSISSIGFELGYADKAYFSTTFKKKSGQTPSEFRKEIKAIITG